MWTPLIALVLVISHYEYIINPYDELFLKYIDIQHVGIVIAVCRKLRYC